VPVEMSNNVFSVLSKYAFRQEENYLTEALAFLLRLLLECNPPAGLGIINRLCGRDPASTFTNAASIAISTQVTTEQGTPDIGIRVGDSTFSSQCSQRFRLERDPDVKGGKHTVQATQTEEER